MTTLMLEELNAFYDEHGILPVRFRCPSRRACSANSPNFTETKASLVGPLYEERRLPRLLFLSLDSGSAERLPERRTAEFQRRDALVEDVATLPKHKHWFRTHEMAFMLLRQFKPDLTHPRETRSWTPRDLRVISHIAHVNSAKCCQNKQGRRQADSTLFDNCRRYIPGELAILRPDVVVTQGAEAEAAVRKLIRPPTTKELLSSSRYKLPARYETGVLRLGRGIDRVLWLHSYHPSNFGRFNPQRDQCWPRYAKDVRRSWDESSQRVGRL